MKIYLLANITFPYGMAGENHILCQMRGIANAGGDVEIILPKRSSALFDKKTYPQKGVYDGMKYEFISDSFFGKTNILIQLYNYFLAPITTFIWAMKRLEKGDIVYQYSANLLLFFTVIIACRLRGAYFVHEIVEIPYLDNKFRHRVRRWMESHLLMPHFDGFVCISHGLLDYCKRFASKKAKFHYMPILVEKNDNTVFTKVSYNVPYIIHTGAMNELKDGISYILKGFAEFKKTDSTGCRLVFTGPHANINKCPYNSMIDKLGIRDCVDLIGMIDREELLNLQNFASMSIVYKVPNIRTNYCFATKIGEILMAGVPLVTTNATENKYFFKDKINAFLVEPLDIDGLARTIKYVLDNPEESKVVASHGQQIALHELNPDYQGKLLVNFFKTVTN